MIEENQGVAASTGGRATQASPEAPSGLRHSVSVPNAGFLLKPFAVTVEGFPTFTFFASTRGKALAQAWETYTTSYNEATFGEFLRIARAMRAPDPPRFGEPITVCGGPAFYVGENMQYVVFARPGETVTHLSHPLDVEPASAMSAFGQDPKGLEAKPASAVGEAETPIPSSSPNQYKGGGV